MHVAARAMPSFIVALAIAIPRAAYAEPIQFAEREVFPDQGYSALANLDDSALPEMVGALDGDIVIRRNLGGRHFAEPIHISMATSGISLPTIVDVNGDGRLDLATTRWNDPALLVRLNLGGLTFGPVTSYPLASFGWGSAVGDLNADSNGDLVLVADTLFTVFLGSSSGVLTPLPTQPLAEAYHYTEQLADLNGDGSVDLVMSAFGKDDRHFEWRAGLGDGAFGDPHPFAPGSEWLPYFSLVDFDHDGDLDFANPGRSEIRCLVNDGFGQFTAIPSISLEGTESIEYTIAAGDLDLDGEADLVVVGYCGGRATENNLAIVVYSAGDSTNRRVERWHVPAYPAWPLVNDLDGDGYPEVAMSSYGEYDANDYHGSSNGNAVVLWNDGRGRLLGKLHLPLIVPSDGPWHWGMISASAGPGRPADLILAARGATQLLRNRGDGSFVNPRDVGFGTPVTAADCDGDGLDEVFVTSSDSLWILRRSAPDADFGTPMLVNAGTLFVGVADLDGDQRLDLILEGTAGRLWERQGDGAGGFGTPRDLLTSLPAMHGNVLLEDFDGDGWTDVATGTPVEFEASDHVEAGVLHLFSSDHAGGFSSAVTDTVVREDGGNWQAGATLLAGDVDGDGDRDIVIYRWSLYATAWFGVFLNHELGGFDAHGTARTIGNPGGTAACADLDGDGLADILTHDNDGLDLDFRVFQATGGGEFGEPQWRIGVHYGSDLVVADFNSDGLPDVAMLSGDGSVGIFSNATPQLGPTPTQLALASAQVVDDAIQLEWLAPGPESFTAQLERNDGAEWRALTTLTSDGLGQVRYRDTDVARGSRYGYRLRYHNGARELLTAESWVAMPTLTFALRPPSPAPVRGVPAFGVSLPARGDAALEILDIAGRRVREQRLSGLAPGDHRVTLEGTPLAPGLYFARLRLDEASARTKFVVIR